MNLCLAKIAAWLGLSVPEPLEITGVSIDTRNLQPGNLFVALRGTRVDGHDFILDAIQRGAAAILCIDAAPALKIPVLQYPNLEKALALIATGYRAQLTCQVVALTGSNGKTTVKEMLGAILGEDAFVTPGNLNNHLGVPLSVLQVKPSHQYAVFELGANHVGEIAHTVAIVKPQVALINNIGSAHIEGFGSMDNIARAKGEIYQGLSATGTAIINADDKYAHFWDDLIAKKQKLCFSSANKNAAIYAENIKITPSGGAAFKLIKGRDTCNITLDVPGMHQVQNALAAASCAVALGVSLDSIAKGLSHFSGVSGRLMSKKTAVGALILDDTYNANLNSVLAGIHVLASHTGTRILVLGDMGELGMHAKAHHEAVGAAAKEEGIDKIFTCGIVSEATSKAFGTTGMHFKKQINLIAALKPILNAKTTVLVKGSRSSTMEQVVAGLL
jgi:UDP-N-acetylmuramoyl-tripeptide--D-alanyl-D-alanine ligase